MAQEVNADVIMAAVSPNPSIPLSDGLCPFSNLSQYDVDHIFSHLTDDTQTKMKLELVCRKFASEIRKRNCWLLDDQLVLGYSRKPQHHHDFRANHNHDGFIYINKVKFDGGQAARALSILLDRITVQNVIILNQIHLNRSDMLSICDVIMGHLNSFHLTNIQFYNISDGSLDETVELLASSLASCQLSNVKKVLFKDSFINVDDYGNFLKCFWKIIANCHSLRYLNVNVPEISLNDLCESIQNCPNIETLKISAFDEFINHEGDMENYITLATLCNSLQRLSHFSLQSELVDPSQFVMLLNADCRSRIEKLNFLFGDSENEREEEKLGRINIAQNAFTLFPNLNKLSLYSDDWDFDTIVSTISNAFDNFNQQNNGLYKVKLIMRTVNPHIAIFLRKLTDVTGLNAKISIENNVYKCAKDNVEIEMDCF